MFPALTGFYVDAETGVKVRPPVDPSLPAVTMEMIDMVTTSAPKGVRKQLKEKRDAVQEYVDKRTAELVSPSKPPVRRFLFARPPIKKAPRKAQLKFNQAKGLRYEATCARFLPSAVCLSTSLTRRPRKQGRHVRRAATSGARTGPTGASASSTSTGLSPQAVAPTRSRCATSSATGSTASAGCAREGGTAATPAAMTLPCSRQRRRWPSRSAWSRGRRCRK